MKIADVLTREHVIQDLEANNKRQALKELASFISEKFPSLNKDKVFETLEERENVCSTAIDEGVAIPHCKISGIPNLILAIARSKKGIEFDSLDGNPTHILILILSPENSSSLHIQALAAVSKKFKDSKLRDKILNASSDEEIYNLIMEDNE